MTRPKSNRSARLQARITPDALAVVKRAAELQERSVSDFVVAAAQDAAQRAMARQARSWRGHVTLTS